MGGTGLDLLKNFGSRAVIDHNADPQKIPISMDSEIVCGVFVNKDKPTFWENVQTGIESKVKNTL